jgi:hypothetical protein
VLVAKLDRLSHEVHFISGLMSVTHLIETTAKLRMPHPWQRTRCCTSRTLSRRSRPSLQRQVDLPVGRSGGARRESRLNFAAYR